MTTGKAIISAVSLIILFTFSAAEAEIVTEHVATDAEMLGYISDTLFVAEGRIGDLGGYATFELDVGSDTGAPSQTENYAWQNGMIEPFTVSYDPLSSIVTFSLGGKTLSFTTPYFDFDQIFVRTRAVNAGSSVEIKDIVLNGSSINDLSYADGNTGLDILWIKGADLNGGFIFQANAVLSWEGTAPTQSRLAFQVKVGKLGIVAGEDFSWGAIKNLGN